ncbi:ANTAR domain-containing protein [Solirubrobacter sp. CPCC 204708]|uniref:ANTAR domain-containing protein n=1 Tax=Solirubrobacter deserti TaxID=2282478 RepID=A0ABT4RTP9_9ACTN|nr:ANTAR domain-containing protein [Solirubrobacter deserti]MBE2318462.1 ANTAR domain-containing protein [Solirubrobacter deserti]MDA0141763.1 ANTAR domain-containing protein [Solirubrobacter deserti]
MTTTSERNLRILLANERKEDLRALGDVLDHLGHEVTPFAVSVAEATELIAREDPDLAFVVLDGDDEHGLALIAETVSYASGPVLVSVRKAESPETIARAADMGIMGYVDSWAPDDLQGAIDVAVRRHREEQRLSEKVAQLESALDRRVIIERAKGILMERHRVGERAAFELLRDHARSSGRRVFDVAQTVLDGHALLPPN